MRPTDYSPYHKSLQRFDRKCISGQGRFAYIGSGSIGGKAHGLAKMKGILESSLKDRFAPEISVGIPATTVITTDFFDMFMNQNDLADVVHGETRDGVISHAFQRANLPVQLVGDLRALAQQVRTPLAIRSSSMLEDAMFEPFASVYATKMISNNRPDADTRFMRLVEAVKFIYASTFFADARNYMRATHHSTMDEKMAVIIQEVIGTRHGDRFYPDISGVARSYNFYPTGHAAPEDGVVDLALGLGRTIVDDGTAWSYSPAYPQADPPYNSIGDLLKHSQTTFWAVNMGKPPAYDPTNETEYMSKCDLGHAEYDGALRNIASTYSPQNDRIVIGTGNKGPRVVNFAPILRMDLLPLNEFLKALLKICEDVLGSLVEIEFAITLDSQRAAPAHFGFLQVRPMVVSQADVDLDPGELEGDNVLVASTNVLGNGLLDGICDVVFVKPEKFDTEHTRTIAGELDSLNIALADSKTPYLLIGFGRWGTSDPQGGIPVKFGQISGAKVIVEASLPDMDFGMSQGSHFFHNVTSFKVFYFSVPHGGQYRIRWECLAGQKTVRETDFVKHVRFPSPITVKVDGKTGRGVVFCEC
jgi:hypothetical protein